MTDKKQRKAPVLRFKGFTNDWEQRKLSDETNRIRSYSISHGFEVAEDTGTKYIHYGDIHTGKVKNINNINVLPNIEDNNYKPLKYGDVIVADASEDYKGIADACIVNTISNSYKIVAGLHTIAFRPKSKLCSKFLYFYLSTDIFKHFGYKTGTGLKVFGISYKELAKLKLKEPSATEQKKIVKLLFLIEKAIHLQQRKLKKIKLLKRAMLQNLFTCKSFPKVRFKGFLNAWEQCNLGEIAQIIGGGTPSTKNPEYWNGSINWYSPIEIGKNIYVSKSNKKITKLGLQYSSAKMLPGKRTILFTSRAGIGDMAIMLTDGCTNQGFQSWVINDQITNIYFLFSLGSFIKKEVIRKASGSTFLEISNKEIKKIKIFIPNKKEQDCIGKLIQMIDILLSLQQQKVKELQQTKEFLLQNMFI